MNRSPTNLIDHVETHLGKMRDGFVASLSDGTPIQVGNFPDRPFPNAITSISFGLSERALQAPSGKKIRHELLMIGRSGSEGSLSDVILAVANIIAGRGRPLLQGEVIGPAGPVVPGATVEALYATNPGYFPEEMEVWEGASGPVVFAWLIPVTPAEAAYVELNGRARFEDEFWDANPDILDFSRETVVGIH